MLHYASLIFQLLLISAPLIAIFVDLRALWNRQPGAPRRLGTSSMVAGGIVLGVGGALGYGALLGGRVGFMQLTKAAYFATALLIVLRWIDSAFFTMLRSCWNRLLPPMPQPGFTRRLLETGPALIRVVALFAIGIPYVSAAIMIYRPRLGPSTDPHRAIGVPYERISFVTNDHMTLAGWWIPSPQPGADETIILCHGIGADKSRMLPMSREFLAAGFNVLLFDFRAHGESDGQISSLGSLEKSDALAAVKWLRAMRPAKSRRILGVGADTGAAALLGAAADSSTDGQAIEAIAVCGSFGDFGAFANEAAFQQLLPPWNWIEKNAGLPIASLLCGADLVHFRPSDAAATLWPRPLLVIHTGEDPIVPFSHGQDLYMKASEPKRRLWVAPGGKFRLIDNPNIARQVIEFFQQAHAVPIT